MNYYKISCGIMAALSFVITVITAIYASSGNNYFGTWSGVLLVLFGLLTVVCLCISTVKGRLLYKIGFYVLHIGLVVAIIGFVIYGVAGKKYNVSVLCDGTYYSHINDVTQSSSGEMVDLGFSFRLDDTYSEYYTDNEGNVTQNPKHYVAYLTVMEEIGQPETVELTVNNPIHVNGYKIYLMGMINDVGIEGATLLFKYNPAEYTILTGLVLIISGTFVMCIFGDIDYKAVLKRLRAAEREAGGDEQ